MQRSYILLLISTFFLITNTRAHTFPDSIGVENYNGKKVVIHKIEAKETYYSLGRKYNVAAKDIIGFNENKSLQPGIIIKVPTQLAFGSASPASKSPVTSPGNLTRHTVKTKENLGMIAERYNTTIAALKTANGLTSSNLSIGQVLKIPGAEPGTLRVTPEVPAVVANQPSAMVEHEVKPKEFLNKIAEKYGTTVEEIKRVNNLSSNNLRIGQVLRIPSAATNSEQPVNAVVEAPRPETPKKITNIDNSNLHTVRSGETIFSIAQKYGLTAYQLRQANNLGGNEISTGQTLIIPVTAPKSVNDASKEDQESNPDSSATIKDPSLKRNPNIYGLNQVEEKGMAVWITDPDLDGTKMLVLHRTVPVGSIIKITNPMSNITGFAKVVGKFTENETTKDVIIVITKAAADKLGVLDKRFFCIITYAVQDNGQ